MSLLEYVTVRRNVAMGNELRKAGLGKGLAFPIYCSVFPTINSLRAGALFYLLLYAEHLAMLSI